MSELLKEETQEREAFTVDNDMKAEWVLSKIRNVRAAHKREKDELTRQMQFYIDQMAVIDKQAEEEEAFFKSMLLPYFQSRVDDGFAKATKTQVTCKLPTGKMVLKHLGPVYERDNAALLAWMKENRPELVKVEESPNWSELKKSISVSGGCVVTKDGEIVPGVKVTEQEDRFDVEVN